MRQTSKHRLFQLCLGIFGIGFLTFFDQLTKRLAVSHLKDAPSISLLPGVFELSYLENHGAAFGILKGQKAFLILMTGITLTVLIFLYFRILGEQRYGCIRLMLAFLISGAIGNFIDRCFHDYVIDFFYFCLIDFPVFNVADIYVTVSVILLFLLFGFYYKEEDLDHLLHLLQFWKKRKTQE